MKAGRALAGAKGVPLRAGETVQPLGDGWLIHDRKGFRPCSWAFELARFAGARPGDRVVDLGCGTGVLSWALWQVHPGIRGVVGVELDPRSADQAHRNARLADANALIVRADVRAVPLPPRAFDLVISNPPFFAPDWGRRSADDRTAAATHALNGDVVDFLTATARILAPHGEAVFVYDAGHLTPLLIAAQRNGLTVRALRFLDDDRGKPARVLARLGFGPGLIIEREPWT